MAQLKDLLNYCNNVLEIERFQDYCPNGLQVEGKTEVKKIISGVTACQALIDAAIEEKADVLLVHHGYFWKGEDARITGLKYKRVRSLIESGMNLLAYHLPLDAHPLFGNNAKLAELLDLDIAGSFPSGSSAVGMHGTLKEAMTAADFSQKIMSALGREALHIGDNNEQIHTIAWCSGAAQSYIEDAAELGVDAYLTGEISEQTVHIAREYGLHFYAAGHHATERYGVQALAEHLASHFDLDHKFVDIPNPV
ncbi:MAG: Nif3-like dinuclear metal center hexameric protein [Gammaproteobacteria bacterium]|nr:Nif3-like dinuclear metal center hexameric protein [Gammaproteobacteria bacterium]MCW8987070.1 Nif3-like dinuclear metal center hexameric protein [Gammaproteobacteria bacterium]MCW9030034.1 Nif3-like dinuclear metal center hexameric protein [Gammaproteobacteria bacterium]